MHKSMKKAKEMSKFVLLWEERTLNINKITNNYGGRLGLKIQLVEQKCL